MEIEEEYNRLMKYFGESNIKTEYILNSDLEILDPRQFSQIKLTYLPLNLQIIGDKKLTQIENAVDALRRLKLIVSKE
ncbi:hypothetical protein L0P88_21875 [Muricauda sp. SCSIO 64092]|uniref:hypothetical protein n=1 Tax=Allomuricauda sp. SCSIO 64092 TaxID=2908842 RepID=UPI001FF1F52D|nr:hypothetical protein [Muricauda sp. SCSIO 64092]UOY06558.1 hypothetical protein L0P88_21875 [Muricauda sp. SCSIO 64092]